MIPGIDMAMAMSESKNEPYSPIVSSISSTIVETSIFLEIDCSFKTVPLKSEMTLNILSFTSVIPSTKTLLSFSLNISVFLPPVSPGFCIPSRTIRFCSIIPSIDLEMVERFTLSS